MDLDTYIAEGQQPHSSERRGEKMLVFGKDSGFFYLVRYK